MIGFYFQFWLKALFGVALLAWFSGLSGHLNIFLLWFFTWFAGLELQSLKEKVEAQNGKIQKLEEALDSLHFSYRASAESMEKQFHRVGDRLELVENRVFPVHHDDDDY